MKKIFRLFFTRFVLTALAFMVSAMTSAADQSNPQLQKIVAEFNQLIADADSEGRITIPRVDALPDSLQSLKLKQPSVQPFVIGGSDAIRREFTEYALVLITNGQSIIGACGGTMIAPTKVLTAAHCAQARASDYFVIPSFYSFRDNFSQRNFFQGLRIEDHPNYRDSSFDYDLAVLTLGRSTTTGVAKVHSGSNSFAKTVGTLIGTGLIGTEPSRTTDILQKVSAPITSNASCNDAYDFFVGQRPITERMMCAGFTTNGRGSCSGDSGGPLFATIDGERVIVGAVSFGFLPCESNRATQAYARVASMESFIRANSPTTQFVTSNAKVDIAPIILLLDEDEAD